MDLHSLRPEDFQQLALALLQAESGVRVTPIALPFGRNDQGYDGRVESGEIDGVAAPMRVEVKRVPTYESARQQLQAFLDRYHDLPVVLLVAAHLSLAEHDALRDLAALRGVSLVLRDGASLVQTARNHPWLAKWYFPLGPRTLRPTAAGQAEGEPWGHLLPVEQAAADKIVERLRAGGAPVIAVHGGSRVRPGLVAFAAAEAFGGGAWVVDDDASDLARRVAEDLGAARRSMVLLAHDGPAQAMLKSRDLADTPLIAVLPAHAAAEWARRARPNGNRAVVIEIARPTLDEIPSWAAALPSDDAWRDAVYRTRPDLIESRLLGAPDDLDVLAQTLKDNLPAPALWAAFGVASLTRPRLGDLLHRFGAARHVAPDALRAWLPDADVDAAIRAGVVERGGDGRLGVVSPLLGLASLHAALLVDKAGLHAALVGLVNRDLRAGLDALRWWVDGPTVLGSHVHDAGPWDAVVAGVLDALDEDRRVVLAVNDKTGRPLFASSEPHATWLIELADTGLRADRRDLVQVAATLLPRVVLAARRWPLAARQAADVLARGLTANLPGLTTPEQVDGVVAELTAPGKVDPGVAADVLKAIADDFTPTRGVVRLARAALRPWMTWWYETGHAEGSMWVMTQRPTPAEGPGWTRAQAAARGLLVQLLQAESPAALAAGLSLLDTASAIPGSAVPGHVDAALSALAGRLSQPTPAIAQALILQTLELLAARPLPPATQTACLDLWRADERLLLLRESLLPGVFPDDTGPARAALATDDLRAAYRALHPFDHADALRTARIQRWLDSVAPAERPAAVRAFISEIAAASEWLQDSEVQPFPRADVLVDLARIVPEPFRDLLEGPGWDTSPEALRPLLAGVLTTAFRDELRAAITQQRGAGGFLRGLLRFIARPDRFADDRGVMWLSVLERISPPASVPAHVYHLARTGPTSLRPRLAAWWGRHLDHERVDPRDGVATTAALLDGDGWPVFEALVAWRSLERLLTQHRWLRAPVAELTLRRFRGLDVEGPVLRPDVTTEGEAWRVVAEDHPGEWWHLRQVVMVDALDPGDAELDDPKALLDALPPALLPGLHRPTTSGTGVHPTNAYGLRSAFDRVIRRLSDDDVRERVRSLPTTASLRVALLAAGFVGGLLPELIETLSALSHRDADLLTAELSSGASGRKRLAKARFVRSLELEELSDAHPLTADAASIEQAGEAHGGHVGDLLHVLAAFARRQHDDPRLLALIERCRGHLQEETDEHSR